MSDAPDKFWMWSSAASKGVAGFWSAKEPGPWDANPDVRLVQIVPDDELARLRELEALVLEWREARADYIALCSDGSRFDINAALRMSTATISLEAWGKE